MTIQQQALESFLKYHGKEISPIEFYAQIFPTGLLADSTRREEGKYVGVFYSKSTLNRHLYDGLEGLDAGFGIPSRMNCISYAGSARDRRLARELHAFIINIQLPKEISPGYIEHCLEGLMQKRTVLRQSEGATVTVEQEFKPTFIATIGSKVFFYYVLTKPIPLYYTFHQKIERFAQELSRAIHACFDQYEMTYGSFERRYIYECYKPQVVSIFSKVEMVGSVHGNDTCKAYKVGRAISLTKLNRLIPKDAQLDLRKSNCTLTEAAEKWPAWNGYRVKKKKPKSKNNSGTFVTGKGVYGWYFNLIHDNLGNDELKLEAIAILGVYARKCDIAETQFLADLDNMASWFLPRFSHEDIDGYISRAISAFKYENIKGVRGMSLNTVEARIGLKAPRNKRNNRTREQHLKLIHREQSSEKDVRRWHKQHLDGTPAQCAEELNVSLKTVYKWWKAKNTTTKEVALCPHCQREMIKMRQEPFYWAKKGKMYSRTNKVCTGCGYIEEGRARPCKNA